MHRSLWVPGGRAEPFFPLCPCRSSWIRRPRASAALPTTRVAAYARSDIIHTRSQQFAWFSHACCCGNCLTVPFADHRRAKHRYRNRLHQCRSAAGSVARCATRRCATRLGRVSRQPGNAKHPDLLGPAARHYYYFLRTDSRIHASGLIFAPQHEGKAVGVVHHRWLLPAA